MEAHFLAALLICPAHIFRYMVTGARLPGTLSRTTYSIIGFLVTLKLQLPMEVSSLGELFLSLFSVLFSVAPTQCRGMINEEEISNLER